MKRILVIGSSGFLGRPVAKALLADGYGVRCLARNPARVQDLAALGGAVVQGDISDLASMERALESVEAVYISIHTLSPQHASTTGQGFMDVEMKGLENIVAACRSRGVQRLIYVTFLGISADSPSAWVRGRWQAEQFLLNSGLDVSMIRPAQIVGVGGQGFDTMIGQAKRPLALMMVKGEQKHRNIALDDLVYYLVGMLDDPRAYGQAFDVGCDDILSSDQMVDVAADVLGRSRPFKIHLPKTILSALAPILERAGKFPKGAVKGYVDSMGTDMIGDPTPIRAILPRPLLSYRQAVERALKGSGTIS